MTLLNKIYLLTDIFLFEEKGEHKVLILILND